MHDWAEFRHFRYLLAILEKGGFRLAAEDLHTSQPNLTVQARQFQDYASVRLYRRLKDGRIQPTEAGLAFISLARFVLEARDAAIDALAAIARGEIESIRLGCNPLVDPNVFHTLCATLKDTLPDCTIWPTHGDAVQLTEALLCGDVDAALIPLSLKHHDLHVEELRQDRLVACLRRDHPLAEKAVLRVSDLQDNLAVFYQPQCHPAAHVRLLELLGDAGVEIGKFSCASHPAEMQALVKEGYGFALIREGTPLDKELTTRRILGVDWTVGTAIAFHRQRCPKIVPFLARKLQKMMQQSANNTQRRESSPAIRVADTPRSR